MPDDATEEAHTRMRREAAAQREAFRVSDEGSLGSLIMQAVALSSRMKADGATDAERFAVIEANLRQFWPRRRQEPWHYACEACRDTGLIIAEGVTNRLGVVVDDGRPCDICDRGQRFREGPRGGGDDFTKAGKAGGNPRGFTRYGR